jgi:hypothetical protein
MENKQKHLEFIQAVISRMAGNLFFLKGWTITLIGALLALFASSDCPKYIFFILVVITTIFWILDGYFLSIERQFRDLYDHVRKLHEDEIDFSMDISKFKNAEKNTLRGSMFSITLKVFYIPLIIALLIIPFILFSQKTGSCCMKQSGIAVQRRSANNRDMADYRQVRLSVQPSNPVE